MSITLYGVNLSPYVRKVRLALDAKGLEYQQIPVIPQGEDKPQEFVENSPLGKIPLMHIDDMWLSDSTAILAYLELSRPEVKLLSDDPKLAAKAIWFEAYSGSHMTSVIGGHLFAELVLAPAFFNREGNQEEIEFARNVEIPAIFDYLESVLCADFLLGNTLGHADICVGSSFVTMGHCQYECDSAKWPKTSAYIDRLMADPLFANVVAEEQQFLVAMAG